MANRIRIDVADLKFEDNTLGAERTLSELSKGDHSDHHIRHESGGADEIDLTGLLPVGGWIEAGETWTYASADDPTFTFTISGDKTDKYSVGMKIKLTQTSVKYFIITKIAYSDPNTTVTIYGGTDYDLADATITLPYYSTAKTPLGFPLNPDKWTVEVTDTTDRIQNTPVIDTWYNLGSVSIIIPEGLFIVSYNVSSGGAKSATLFGIQTTLSTANNSESDNDFTIYLEGHDAIRITGYKSKVLSLASKTTYYLNTRALSADLTNIANLNSKHKLFLRAICAYL